MLVSGEAGVGKSSLVQALAARAEAAGWSVLRSWPTSSEADLPFLALIDLLTDVDTAALADLDPRWRTILAQLHTDEPTTDHHRTALGIRLATRHLLRQLTGHGQVLLVVDELPWIDQRSAEVLGFVARRCHRIPVRMLATARTPPHGTTTSIDDSLCPPPVHHLPLSPLSAEATYTLLTQRLGAALPRAIRRGIYTASQGNPLYALELARQWPQASQATRLGQPPPVPARLRQPLDERLAGLSRPARRTLLFVSAAAHPTVELLQRVGDAHVTTHLAAARRRGIIAPPAGQLVRFSHPLLAATLYAQASTRQRRLTHAALADAVNDPIEQARHRALASHAPDAGIADELAQAAQVARQRASPAVAAELGVAAADIGPHGQMAAQRRLQAGRDALCAGDRHLAQQAAAAVLAGCTLAAQRVHAWLILLDVAGQPLAHRETMIGRAWAETGADPGLQAKVYLHTAAHAWRRGRLNAALAQARRCVELATDAGDPVTVQRALSSQAWAQLALGTPEFRQSFGRLHLINTKATIYHAPQRLRARWDLVGDRVEAAREQLLPLCRLAQQKGCVADLLAVLLDLAEVELRAGRGATARRMASRCLALVRDTDLATGPVLAVAALVEAQCGDPTRARALAGEGVEACDTDGDRVSGLGNLHAMVMAALVCGDGAAAAEAWGRIETIESAMDILDPAVFRWHADVAEALVLAQRPAEAEQVITRVWPVAQRLGRLSVQACLARSRAWLHLARRQPHEAAHELYSAVATLRHLPLEYGRTWYALAVVERRRRRRAAATAAFRQAEEAFHAAGAEPWAARVRQELASSTPTPATVGELTVIEHRIAALVNTGATNRQIATALSLSVKTVEAYLTSIYRKVRVRSRAELAGRLANTPVT